MQTQNESKSRKSRKINSRVKRAASSAASAIERLEQRQLMTVLVGYTTVGLSATGFGGTSVNPSVTDTSVTSSTLTRGSGVGTGGTGSANAFGGSGFNTSSSSGAAALAANQYFTFPFTVAAGKADSLTEFDESARVSGTGPASEDVYYTLTGTRTVAMTDLGTLTLRSSAASTTNTLTITSAIAADPNLQNIPGGTTVTFTFAPYGATSTGGTYNVYNNAAAAVTGLQLDVQGSVTQTAAQTITLNASASSVAESAGSVSLTVTRAATSGGDISGTVTVPYNTTNGTAVSGTNYSGTQTGSLTFGPGVTSQTITVSILPNNPQGGNKTFTINLGAPTLTGDTGVSAVDGTPASATITIVDTAASYGFASPTFNVNETAGVAEVSVTRTGDVADAATATYVTTSGSALDGPNYTGTQSGTVSFAANQSTSVLSIPISNVSPQNGNKSFTISLTGVTPTAGDYGNLGTQATATETIIDVAALNNVLTGPASSITDVEANGYYVSNYTNVNGDSSGAGSFGFLAYEVLDFNATTSPSIYPAGSSTITSVSNLSLQLYNTVATPANGGTGTYAAHPGNIDVYYSPDTTTNDTASASSTLTFAGTTPTGINVAQFSQAPVLLGTFSFSGSAVGYDTYTPASLSPAVSSALQTALNNKTAFRFIVTPASVGVGAVSADFDFSSVPNGGGAPLVSFSGTLSSVPESFYVDSTSATINSAPNTATITVDRSTLSGNSLSDAATVTYTTVDGTAVNGRDYSGGTGTAVFAANASTTSFSIPILSDTAVYGDKTFYVMLTGTPTVGTGRVGTVVSPTTESVTVLDSRTTDVTALTNDLAVVQVPGVSRNSNSQTAVTYFTVESNNTGNGTFASFAVADIQAGTLSSTVGTINSLAIDLINTAASFASNGLIDAYLVSDTTTAITISNTTLDFDATGNPVEGLGSQLGTKSLLGQFTFNKTQSTTNYTAIPLTGASSATLAQLVSDLNTDAVIRIVLTPEDTGVAARFVGEGPVAGVIPSFPAPELSFNYTPYVAGSLPAYLDPASQATYNSANNTVTVTGPTTFIADPGTSAAPNVIASGTSATISFNTTSGSQLHLTSLSLTSGAVATENNPSTRPVVLEIASNGLSIDSTSKLDIGTGDVDVSGGSLAAITALAARGYNLTGGGNWNGTGITSSAAASNASHLTAVGVISDPTTGTFDGDSSAVAGDILVKYTYFGDANLSGKVDGSDYSLIDGGYKTTKTGWYNGDFNYDGTIDGSDYALIDNAFNLQGSPLKFSPSALVAAVESATVSSVVSTRLSSGTGRPVDESPAVPPRFAGNLVHPVATFRGQLALPPSLFSTTPIASGSNTDSGKAKGKKGLAGSIVDLIGKSTD